MKIRKKVFICLVTLFMLTTTFFIRVHGAYGDVLIKGSNCVSVDVFDNNYTSSNPTVDNINVLK